MRKITSKYEKKKRLRIKQSIVGGILIFIIFISTLGYSFQGSYNSERLKIVYNNIDFTLKDNFWIMQKGEEDFVFKYNPQQTEIFEFEEEVGLLNDYSNRPLYLYSEHKESELEIYRNLYKISQRIQFACLDPEIDAECKNSWPIKNCSDNFILIKEGDFKVEKNENCIFIEGPIENLTQISDEFLFKLIGIK